MLTRIRLAFAVTLLCMLWGNSALADEYEVFIDIETEEDLYDLLAEQQISDDTFNTLLLLFQRGVDLNTASREELFSLPNLTYPDVDGIIAYREEAGLISDPATLVSSRVLSDRKLLAIAVFLRIADARRAMYATDGLIRTQTRWSNEDDRMPPLAILARVATLKHLQVGVAGMVTRNRLGDVVYDPNRQALSAEAASKQLHIPKFYASWDKDNYSVVAGTYRVGFGQRLT
ncbi:MAG: helix-hairpin-helix domain-containing protein, partial [Deltaproteobacteria bacterium]|nr:helix-hairpin-helix domain-containing protein [Deltaproteobacteria bacterium]